MNRTMVLVSIALFSTLGGVAAAADPDRVLAVVVDRDNPRSDISVAELKEIFRGNRREWADGARIIPLDLTPGPARDGFNKKVMGMDQSALDQYWVEQKVRGAGSPPRVVSATTAVKLVPRVRGAVAYVPLSEVDASLKVLTVAGLAPDAPGYPIAW